MILLGFFFSFLSFYFHLAIEAVFLLGAAITRSSDATYFFFNCFVYVFVFRVKRVPGLVSF